MLIKYIEKVRCSKLCCIILRNNKKPPIVCMARSDLYTECSAKSYQENFFNYNMHCSRQTNGQTGMAITTSLANADSEYICMYITL